jgi:hypothetical protein
MYSLKKKEKVNDPNKYLEQKDFKIFTCFNPTNLNFDKVNAKKLEYKLNGICNNDCQDSFIPRY